MIRKGNVEYRNISMEFFIVTFQSISTGVSALADRAFVFLVAQVDRHVSLQVIPPEACTAQT